MSITDWFTNLGPKRKFAIKSIAKIAAVSVPLGECSKWNSLKGGKL